MRTSILAGLLAATVLTPAAFAQTTTPTKETKANETVTVPAPHWRSSKLIGVNVYNEQNEKLGDISEVVLDPAGKVLGYVVGVGGFLGMGEHDILVEPSKIKFVNEPARSAANDANTKSDLNAPTNTRNVSNTSGSTRAAGDVWYPDHGILSATKNQLKAMPQFKYSAAAK